MIDFIALFTANCCQCSYCYFAFYLPYDFFSSFADALFKILKTLRKIKGTMPLDRLFIRKLKSGVRLIFRKRESGEPKGRTDHLNLQVLGYPNGKNALCKQYVKQYAKS